MTDLPCSYSGDREAAVVGFLYDDLDAAERAAFERHLAGCGRCRTEIDELRGIRRDLTAWAPPVPAGLASIHRDIAAPSRRWAMLREMPAWAQAAAAILIAGVAAGAANLNVRYDATGLSVRTGWRTVAPVTAAPANATPWRADLAVLERQLRTELAPRADATTVRGTPAAPPVADAELLKRVRALVNDSERRQQRELALRLAEVMRDVETQRRTDLVKIDRSLGVIQNNTGVEVLRQRELLNYLVRASQKQ